MPARRWRRRLPRRSSRGRRTGWIRAVDGVSLAVWPGETLGLVGESGCGKSTLGKTVMGIYTPTAGDIRFAGREIGHLPARERRAVAGDLQYVYQDPGASLDPRWKVVHSLHEPLKIHARLSRAEREREVGAILSAVGLPDAHLDLYPHELSGGQQRRVAPARGPTPPPARGRAGGPPRARGGGAAAPAPAARSPGTSAGGRGRGSARSTAAASPATSREASAIPVTGRPRPPRQEVPTLPVAPIRDGAADCRLSTFRSAGMRVQGR